MMALLHVAVAVLTLLSVGHSAPVADCETLTKPVVIQGREQLLGTWTYVAESTNIAESKFLTKRFVDTVWGKLTAGQESDVIHHYQVQKIFGQCFTMRTNLTLANSTISMTIPYFSSANLLNTGCADCLVLMSSYNISGIPFLGLQLLSKRQKVSAAELQEFTKQVECLNLPSPAVLDSEKGFCPDESSSPNPQAIDLTNMMANTDSDFTKILGKILKSGSLTKMLLQLMPSSSELVNGIKN